MNALRAAWLAGWLAAAGASGQVLLEDGMDEPRRWQANPSEGVSLALAVDEGRTGRALRLDIDYRGGAGWAAVRREAGLELPESWELSIWVRGELPPNDLEIKLIDPSGENVWWVNRRAFDFPRAWQRIVVKKRHVEFAWGPAGGGEIRRLGAVEIVVTASEGGKGAVWLDEMALVTRGVPAPLTATPAVRASSAAPGRPAHHVVDGDPRTAWRSAGGGAQWLEIDYGQRREAGAVRLDWAAGAHARRYRLEARENGRWEPLDEVEAGTGGRDWIPLPGAELEALRLELLDGPGDAYELVSLELLPPEVGESDTRFWEAVAAAAPRGRFPRAFLGEQVTWTVVGVDADRHEALLSEDGALEPDRRFSLEPFLLHDGRLVSWADVETSHSLAGGDLPIPTVAWRHAELGLEVTTFADGAPGASSVLARYRVSAAGERPRRVRLALAVRPFQVNPPWQFLGRPGGPVRIFSLGWDGCAVAVGGRAAVVPLTQPLGFGAAALEGGEIAEHLAAGARPPAVQVSDRRGWASGALEWDIEVGGGRTADVWVALPLHDAPPAGLPRCPAASLGAREAAAAGDAALTRVAAAWRERLSPVTVEIPAAPELAATLRTVVAHVLINRDGPAIQPGSRSYERSWIRDGALTSLALLRLGQPAPVREFLVWFASHLFPTGRVPCCADRRGADPVPEHDSHGELLFLAGELVRYTDDEGLARELLPRLASVVAFLEGLRAERTTAAYASGPSRIFYGLLPESISHEGYSARPVHSYWDDFWALIGLDAMTELATRLGEDALAARASALSAALRADLHASIAAVMAAGELPYVPASADLGDEDPTSTTIALEPGAELERLPRAALERTFDRYLADALARPHGIDWEAYTPYELRTVGALVRLGRRDDAWRLLQVLFADRRPAGWNAWAEVVFREERAPRFIGDIPHTWVGTDFARSLLDMLAYERRSDQALVLAAGVPDAWLERGVRVRELRTPWGRLTFDVRREGDTVRAMIDGLTAMPPGGLHVALPGRHAHIRVNGTRVEPAGDGSIRVPHLPAEVLAQ